jgi:hypothetical protein
MDGRQPDDVINASGENWLVEFWLSPQKHRNAHAADCTAVNNFFFIAVSTTATWKPFNGARHHPVYDLDLGLSCVTVADTHIGLRGTDVVHVRRVRLQPSRPHVPSSA